MAEFELKKISQEELDEILKEHSSWLSSNEQIGERANLSFYDLKELKFPIDTNLSGANLSGANLSEAKLIRANLNRANLNKANLTRVNLKHANFVIADLTRANLTGADLTGANLTGANLTEANLTHTKLMRADLEGSIFQSSILIGTNFTQAKLMSTDFRNTNLERAILIQARTDNALGIPKNLSPINLTEKTHQQQLKINQLEQELQQTQAETNQSEEQQAKIAKLEKQIELAKQQEQELQRIKEEKEKLEQDIKDMLKTNIKDANEALTNALQNTDLQINKNQTFSEVLTWFAVILIVLDIVFVLAIPFFIIAGNLNDLLDKTGIWAILFFTFPAVLVLLIALSLLRHQKQVIAEIRHYSMLKHKIELYGGILKAAQYTALSVMQSQNSEAATYIKETFNEIKAELLKSPHFDLNSQPQISPEEGGNLVEILKSTMELVKTSTETSKAAAESVKKIASSTEK